MVFNELLAAFAEKYGIEGLDGATELDVGGFRVGRRVLAGLRTAEEVRAEIRSETPETGDANGNPFSNGFVHV